jgi:hypothetical protein
MPMPLIPNISVFRRVRAARVAAVVRAASLACQNTVKAQKFVPLQESSEECRLQKEFAHPSAPRFKCGGGTNVEES